MAPLQSRFRVFRADRPVQQGEVAFCRNRQLNEVCRLHLRSGAKNFIAGRTQPRSTSSKPWRMPSSEETRAARPLSRIGWRAGKRRPPVTIRLQESA